MNIWTKEKGAVNYVKKMRYQVLTAASMKITVFWDVAPSGGSLPTFQRCLLPPSSRRWNVGKLLSDYMAHHPRRQSSA
jgi:hypothetical protein